MEKNTQPSAAEQESREMLIQLFENRPIPNNQILENLEVFMRPQRFYEVLSLFSLYQKIVDVPGTVMEFGVR